MLVVSVAESLSERESEKLRESVSVWLRVGELDIDSDADIDEVVECELLMELEAEALSVNEALAVAESD